MANVEKRTDSQATMLKVLIGLTVAAMVVVFARFVFVLARRLDWTLGWIYVGMVVASCDHQPGVPAAVEPRADPAPHAPRQVYKDLGQGVGCAVRARNDRNLRCRSNGGTRQGFERAGGSVAAGPGHLRPRMGPCHLVHGRESVLREDGAHPDGPRTSRDRHGPLRLHAPPRLRGLLRLDALDATPACVDLGLRSGPNHGGLARDPHGA